MNEQEIAGEMALNRAVDRQMDFVVQAALRVANLLKDGVMRQSQLRNVLNTAQNTESLEAIANFIRYQIGRSNDWQRNNFGEELIAALKENGAVDRAAREAAADAAKQIRTMEYVASEHDLAARARLKLTRRFLGELLRAYAYANGGRGWRDLEPILASVPVPGETRDQPQ